MNGRGVRTRLTKAGIDLHIDRISGSDHWPSSDPKDSPFDDFECRRCGATWAVRMGGEFPIDFVFDDGAAFHYQHCLGSQEARGRDELNRRIR